MSIDFRSIGTYDENNSSGPLNPGAPAGVVVGDVLLCSSSGRQGGREVDTPTGWIELAFRDTNGTAVIFGRIADGGANDTPTIQWDASTQVSAVLVRYDGDVPADINDLVPAGGDFSRGGTTNSNGLFVPATTDPGGLPDDITVFATTRKSKTSSSSGAVIDFSPDFTGRGQDVPGGNANLCGVADVIQIGAFVPTVEDWSHTNGESSTCNGLAIIMQPAGSVEPPPVFTGPIPDQDIQIGVPYSFDVSGFWDPTSLNFTAETPLPDGLTISNSGIISGTPT